MCLILVIISLASIGGSTSCFDEIIYRCWHTLSLVLLSHHKTHPVMLTRIIRPPLIVLADGVHAALRCVQVSAGLVQRFCYFAGLRRRAKISETANASCFRCCFPYSLMQIVTPQLISFGNLPLIVCICFPYLLPSPWFPLTISSLSLAGWQSLL